jgi:hypothetical protein
MRLLEKWADMRACKGEEHLPELLQIERKELVTDGRVPGRLLGHEASYEAIGAEPYIVQTVRSGYRLEFDMDPPASFLQNNASVKQDPDFVWAELTRLERLGCIRRTESRPWVVNPLSLVHSGKWRLVLDASRGLNPYCTVRGIKLDDLSHIPYTVRRGDYMVVNDLDSGYWHVPVAVEHWKYLGVAFMDPSTGRTIYWVWVVMCLGLRDAAHVFTRLVAPVMAQLRREGVRGLCYIGEA